MCVSEIGKICAGLKAKRNEETLTGEIENVRRGRDE